MTKLPRVILCSVVHRDEDPRIIHKEAVTISNCFPTEVYICSEYRQRKINEHLTISGIPPWRNRLQRLKNGFLIFRQLMRKKFDVLFIYNPEFLPYVPLLKKKVKCRIVYDIHENFQELIREEKNYLPSILRKFFASGYSMLEKVIFPYLDAIMVPVDAMLMDYQSYSTIEKILLRNLPRKQMFEREATDISEKQNRFIYLGLLDFNRGIEKILEAFGIVADSLPDYHLLMIGQFGSEKFKHFLHKEIEERGLNGKIIIQKAVPYREVPKLLSQSKVGLLLYPPTGNWLKSLPNKLWEYLAAGLPQIASDFPIYKEIIEKAYCGICVDPTQKEKIVWAMKQIVSDEQSYQKMSSNARRLFLEKFNWEKESEKLINLIDKILQ